MGTTIDIDGLYHVFAVGEACPAFAVLVTSVVQSAVSIGKPKGLFAALNLTSEIA